MNAALGKSVERRVDRAMIGLEERLDALRLGGRTQILVSRHRHAVARGWHRGGIVEIPVAVDDQARIARENGGRVEPAREPASHIRRADVPADVKPQALCIDAEVA